MEKGIYLVSESSCMVSTTGAYVHIQAGLKELGKSFNIKLVCNFKDAMPVTTKLQKGKKVIVRDNRSAVGFLRDVRILIKNHLCFFESLKKMKSEAPSFIYERASYLNFTGLIAARMLGIRHFYEANGIQYPRNNQYYASCFKPVARCIEKWAYRNSDFVFFVGTHGDFLKLKTSNWKNIENGVEKELLSQKRGLKKVSSGKINICFIANLMQHHGPDFLIEAAKKIKSKNSIQLHLIGSGMERVKSELETEMDVILHGFVGRDVIPDIMKDMHVGIIAGGKEYSSHMKLFDYACFKCVVIAPDIYNFKYWFGEHELVFFKKGDSAAMAERIDEVCREYSLFNIFADRLFLKVESQFTWEYIFDDIKRHISSQS